MQTGGNTTSSLDEENMGFPHPSTDDSNMHTHMFTHMCMHMATNMCTHIDIYNV